MLHLLDMYSKIKFGSPLVSTGSPYLMLFCTALFHFNVDILVTKI